MLQNLSLNFNRSRKAFAMILVGSAMAVSCASKDVQKASLPETADPVAEIQRTQDRLNADRQQQIDVVAPRYFSKAEARLSDARKASEKGKSTSKVKEDIEWANGYLDKAEQIAGESATILAPILEARRAAVNAQAPVVAKSGFKAADVKLIDLTEDFKAGTSKANTRDLTELQSEYLNLELASIKAVKLNEARILLGNAEKQNAAKYSPQTLAQTRLAIVNAERTIETDRHNQALVDQASRAATMQARKLAEVVRVAKGAKTGSAEATALAMYDRSSQLQTSEQQLAQTEQQNQQLESRLQETSAEAQSQTNRMNTAIVDLQGQNSELQGQNQNLQGENSNLAKEKEFNAALAQAQKEFKSSEADVYRQGDNLVVRLKSMSFPQGKATLPASSAASLDKVKTVISSLKAEKIVIEGHTDSTGTAEINKEISQKRADTVKDYLVTEGVVAENQVEAVGQGYEKPISTNKTSAGRKQNRRVDIVITPSTAL
ncbi:MAG: OmpA family protein [Bdellovibrionota bacterium]